jgi:hypothetical protein
VVGSQGEANDSNDKRQEKNYRFGGRIPVHWANLFGMFLSQFGRKKIM